MTSSFHCFIWGVGRPLILSVICIKFALSASCTNNLQEWLFQSVLVLFQFSLLSQESKNRVSEKVVLVGRSSYTPPTITSSLLSTRMVLFIGSVSPNRALARERLSNVVDGSFNASRLPDNISRVNISGKSCCTHLPAFNIFLSPTDTIWSLG